MPAKIYDAKVYFTHDAPGCVSLGSFGWVCLSQEAKVQPSAQFGDRVWPLQRTLRHIAYVLEGQ